jgi:hypothetical protein
MTGLPVTVTVPANSSAISRTSFDVDPSQGSYHLGEPLRLIKANHFHEPTSIHHAWRRIG